MSSSAIKPAAGKAARTFLHSQLFCTPPVPTHDFTGQTVIVTGSNTGLGLEAAKHFYRLGAAKLILAVRTVSKGEAAKKEIQAAVPARKDGDAIEVWPLDMGSTSSTLDFAARANKLDRLDVVVENAGVGLTQWTKSDGVETVIQVNVLNTMLLALSVYGALKTTAEKHQTTPHLAIVTSELHHFAKLPQVDAPDLYAELNDKEKFDGPGRYNGSKLIQVLFVRELVQRLPAPTETAPHLPVLTLVNPGFCKTTLTEKLTGPPKYAARVFKALIGRTPEMGGRTLVAGACAGRTSHGCYMSDGVNEAVDAWMDTEGGKRVQAKVFKETMQVLEQRKPGLGASIGL